MEWEDPIVKEVRDIREAIAVQHHHDVRAIGHYYQGKQAQASHKLVTRVSRQIESQIKNS